MRICAWSIWLTLKLLNWSYLVYHFWFFFDCLLYPWYRWFSTPGRFEWWYPDYLRKIWWEGDNIFSDSWLVSSHKRRLFLISDEDRAEWFILIQKKIKSFRDLSYVIWTVLSAFCVCDTYIVLTSASEGWRQYPGHCPALRREQKYLIIYVSTMINQDTASFYRSVNNHWKSAICNSSFALLTN